MKKNKFLIVIFTYALVISNFIIPKIMAKSVTETAIQKSSENKKSSKTKKSNAYIDLSIHDEIQGDFTSKYTYENPFKGQDTLNGVSIQFKVKSTGDIHVLGTIFSIIGSGDYEGRLYFTPGSYLGYNSPNYGGFFDANLKDYKLVEDYIGNGAKIRIDISKEGFNVYSNNELCYNETILDSEVTGTGDFNSSSDFTPILQWLANADTLNFGYGSWWNAVKYDEANINLSNVICKLGDGTVVNKDFNFKKLQAKNEKAKKKVQKKEIKESKNDINSIEKDENITNINETSQENQENNNIQETNTNNENQKDSSNEDNGVEENTANVNENISNQNSSSETIIILSIIVMIAVFVLYWKKNKNK